MNKYFLIALFMIAAPPCMAQVRYGRERVPPAPPAFLPSAWKEDSNLALIRREYDQRYLQNIGKWDRTIRKEFDGLAARYAKSPSPEVLFRLVNLRWLGGQLDPTFRKFTLNESFWSKTAVSAIKQQAKKSSSEWGRAVTLACIEDIEFSDLKLGETIEPLFAFFKDDPVLDYMRPYFAVWGPYRSPAALLKADAAVKRIAQVAPGTYFEVMSRFRVLSTRSALAPKNKTIVRQLIDLCEKMESLAPPELAARAKNRTLLWRERLDKT